MSGVTPEVLDAVRRDAQAAMDRSGTEVRALHSLTALGEARAIWDAVWPNVPGATEITGNLIRAIEHAGGYVGGAYDGDRMVGACLAFLGRTRGAHGWHTHLHSHMAGVLPGSGDRGIGTALKLHQRAWALEQDIDRIVWTFDPLVRRNARLNLAKLGGVGVEYLVDFYGVMDDALNAGEPSDRLLLQWDLASDRVADALAGTASRLASDEWRAMGAEDGLAVDDAGPRAVPVAAPVQLVALPDDIVELRGSAPALARQWRLAVRDALSPVAAGSGRVVALTTDGHYVLEVGS
jgi:predicted GNAT superfamily acetyltransferase